MKTFKQFNENITDQKYDFWSSRKTIEDFLRYFHKHLKSMTRLSNEEAWDYVQYMKERLNDSTHILYDFWKNRGTDWRKHPYIRQFKHKATSFVRATPVPMDRKMRLEVLEAINQALKNVSGDAEFQTEQSQQIDEATTRGKATITVVDKEPTLMEGTIVHKTDGFMPNIEVGLKWNPDKQNGNLVLMMDMTKGSFEDKRYFKKFIKESTDILEQLDDLESALMVGRVKQAEKVLKMLGARVEIK